jgi:BirA family transcriptional regulator, biotin operon repressor / biotin---[acetyl-CoA-carboxylase] ligase
MEFTPQILRRDSVDSTNSEVARLAQQGAAEGLCIVAEEQTAGRGRLQRQWESPRGSGLYFSTLLEPRFPPDRWPLLTLMAAVAVHDTLKQTCNLQLEIKWPNDILAQGKKLCGILAETIDVKAARCVVLGIGINLKRTAQLPETATSVEAVAAAKTVDTEIILQTLIENVTRYYKILNAADGAAQIVDAWTSRSSYAYGKRIRVSANEETFEGLTRGLEADGALRVETDDGNIRTVRAGDVIAVRPDERNLYGFPSEAISTPREKDSSTS